MMDDREVAGVRRAITWLHEEAKRMNDDHAVTVLNNAAFHLGVELKRWRGDFPESTKAIDAFGSGFHYQRGTE